MVSNFIFTTKITNISYALCLSGWSSYMTQIMETRGIFACLYFIALVILGAFFVINLVVAVIYNSYSSNQDDTETKDHLVLLMQTLGHAPDDDESTASTVIGDYVSRKQTVTSDVVRDALDKFGDDSDEENGEEGKDMAALETTFDHEDDSIDGDDFDDDDSINQSEDRHIRSLVHFFSRRYPGVLSDAAVQLTHSDQYLYVKKRCNALVSSVIFEVAVFLLIVFNIAVLVILVNGATGAIKRFASISNTTCTILFTVELALQIFATSIPSFLSKGFNILDTLIVASSLLELGMGSDHGVSAFRSLRAFRTLRLFKRSTSLQQLLFTIFESASGLGYFCLVLMLYLFIGALSGMALFAGKLDNNYSQVNATDISSSITDQRANFDTIYSSFLTTFQIATGEGWTSILFRAMDYQPVLGAFYCVLAYIFGFLCVLKLFLVLILDTCSTKDMEGLSYYDSLERNQDVKRFGEAGSKIWTAIWKYFKSLTIDVNKANELGSIQFVNMATKHELEKANRFKHNSIWPGIDEFCSGVFAILFT